MTEHNLFTQTPQKINFDQIFIFYLEPFLIMNVLKIFIKKLYYKYIPELRRKQIYKLLHRSEIENVRTAVYPSEKGNFSLRGFDREKAIFVHIPKAAGTSIALSIFGELPYHYKAIDYIVFFGRKTFNQYFKFAFVRNPWDRVYSAYTYLRKGGWDKRF